MARVGSDSDFDVEVDGVGTFRFGRRSMRDEIKIQVEFARIIEGVTPTEWLAVVAGWIAALKVLTVRAPDGWDIDAMDPLDDESYAKMAKVHRALTEKERSFRRKPAQASQAAGEGESGNNGVLVPAQV